MFRGSVAVTGIFNVVFYHEVAFHLAEIWSSGWLRTGLSLFVLDLCVVCDNDSRSSGRFSALQT